MNVSVVVPLYNKENSISNTIDTILGQVYDFDIEVVVVNDGSTDRSEEVVNKIKDERVVLINKKNGGESDARNIGILNSKYEYIAFLDADDEWTPCFLSEIKALKNRYPTAEVFCTKYERVSGINKNEPQHQLWGKKSGIIVDYFKEVNFTLGDMIMTSSSTCLTKGAISKAGLFYHGDKLGADQDLWFRIVKKNIDIAFSNKVCARYILDADERVCNSFERFNHLKFIMRCYSAENKKCENRYLANARLGAINEVIIAKGKLKASLCIIKEFKLIINATPRRLFATLAKLVR